MKWGMKESQSQEKETAAASGGKAGWPVFDVKEHTSREFRLAFFSACVMGIVTHLYIFTNLILNHDSVWRLFYDNDHLTSGRWFLRAASEASTQFQLPVVIGVLSILALALSAGLTVRVLEISHPVCVVLTSGFLVTFPSAACIFSYLFTADAYFIALLFNALGVYLTRNRRLGWIPGVILLTLGCGTYQAFICYAIGLFVFDCLVRLLSSEDVGAVVRRGVKYIAVALGALVGYYVTLRILLAVNHAALLSYQGLDGMSITNIKGFLAQIPAAYQSFIRYFVRSPYLTKGFQAVQLLLCLLFLGCGGYLTVARGLYKEPLRLGLIVLEAALLPLALNFITVLSVGARVHALMIYAFVLLFVFAVKTVEMAMGERLEKGRGGCRLLSAVNTVLCGLLIWNSFCVCNIAYLRLQVCYENSYALANRIVARVEELDGYSPKLPVAVVGEAPRGTYGGTLGQFSPFNSLTGTNDLLLYSPEPHIRTRRFIDHYIGVRMPTPTGEQKAMLSGSETVREMPAYPAKGSVALVDGVIVVKLSEGEVR